MQVPWFWVAFVDIAREQAAAGVGHAQRAVDENFDLHFRHLAANFGDFIQRQLAGENNAGESHLLPELDRRPVDGVGLYRQVNIHMREIFAHQHDQPRVGHDQRVRPHFHHRLQIANKRFSLALCGAMLTTT